LIIYKDEDIGSSSKRENSVGAILCAGRVGVSEFKMIDSNYFIFILFYFYFWGLSVRVNMTSLLH